MSILHSSIDTPPESEGALFRRRMGEAWRDLHPDIQQRFDHPARKSEPTRFAGTMSIVWCSRVGRVLGWIVGWTGALMPHRAKDVPVNIEVWADGSEIFKRRTYRFSSGESVQFNSRMHFSRKAQLTECVGGGMGMYLKVWPEPNSLCFSDDGCFLEIGRLRLALPSWLGPGRIRLTHTNLDARRFAVAIEIRHPVFGLTFLQRGEFEHQ